MKNYKNFYIKKSFCLSFICFIVLTSISAISYRIAYKYTAPVVYTQEQRLKSAAQQQEFFKQGATLINFKTQDNINIQGLALKRPGASYSMVVCHGYHRDLYDAINIVSLFDRCNILLFDFRAHGTSQHHHTSISLGALERQDVSAALTFAKYYFKEPQLPIVGIGFSMGAAALIGAVAQGAPCDALIVDSCFEELAAQIKRVFNEQTSLPLFPFYYLSALFFYAKIGTPMAHISPLVWAANITRPTLIIHSQNDDFTQVNCSYKLQKAFAGPVQTWYPAIGPHALTNKLYPQEYKQKVQKFLEQYLDIKV